MNRNCGVTPRSWQGRPLRRLRRRWLSLSRLCEADVRLRQMVNMPLEGRVNRDNQAAFNGSMRRYLNACKMLAIVQRLNLPSIQVNIAEQQVVANG